MKVFFTILLVYVTGFTLAQRAPGSAYLLLPVDYEVINGDYKGAYLYVRRGSETVATLSAKRLFKVRLDYNSEYKLDFVKDGYITKSIRVNTGVAEDRRKIGFDPYKIGVRLFKQYEGVNIVIYNQPVAFIRYIPELDEFSYDTDYTKSILSALTATEKELEEKASEERERMRMEKAKPKPTPPLIAVNDSVELNGRKSSSSPDTPVERKKRREMERETVITNTPPVQKEESDEKKIKAYQASMGQDHDKSILPAAAMGEDMPDTMEPSRGLDSLRLSFPPRKGKEVLPMQPLVPLIYERTEERIVEANRIITILKIRRGNEFREYRKVSTSWGGNFYFMEKNKPISEHLFYFYTSQ
jgi:hypothetical protein